MSKPPTIAGELRRQAEARLQAKTAKQPQSLTMENMQRLIHELEVHQIELEMQNDELSLARDEMAKVLDKYTDLYDFAPLGYLTLNRNGIIHDANLTAAALLGVERSRLTGQHFGFFIPEDNRPAFADFREKVFTSQKKESCELTLTRVEKPPLIMQIEAIAFESGQECRFAVIDITERRRMTEALRESEAHYRTLFNSIDEGFCVIEVLFDENDKPIDYRFLETNPSFEKQTGLINAEGKRMRELAPKHEEHWFEIYGRIALTGQPVRFQNRAEQLQRWFDVYAFQFGQPEKLQVAVLFKDITERKQAEAEIEHLASFPLMNPNPILELDFNGQMIYCNPAAKLLLENEGGKNRPHPLIPQDVEVILQDLRENKAGRFHREVEINGRIFSENIYIVPTFQSVRIYSLDITERSRAEEIITRLNAELAARAADLESANRELEAFNYTVAHDLRTPLNTLSLSCLTIEIMCGEQLDEECRGYVRNIYNSTLHMNQLINVLLTFSRMGHVEPRREKVALCALALEVVAVLQQNKPERQIDWRIADGIEADGDANLLRVVLDNLLNNAWKYTGKQVKPVIEFGVREIDGVPTYFVRDNGNGFDMAAADKLFAPFQRLPGAEEGKGFGIGLATVERIIRRHGGRIWAEGEPGKGATFFFTLATDEKDQPA